MHAQIERPTAPGQDTACQQIQESSPPAGSATNLALIPHLIFLRELGAHEVPHSGRSFIEHLSGTYDLLKSWGCDEDVALAGLYHSIYGTNAFDRSTLRFEQRDALQERIGERAEYLAWIFCVVERPKVFIQALKTRTLVNRHDGVQISINADVLRDLVCIECANLIEQHAEKGFLSRLMSHPEAGRLGLPVALKTAVNQYIQNVGLPVSALAQLGDQAGVRALAQDGVQVFLPPAKPGTPSSIRAATEADVVELVYLARELHADSRWQWTYFDKTRTAKHLRDWLKNPDCLVLVAQRGADIIGFACARLSALPFTNGQSARIESLYVQHRHRGVMGLRLLHRIVTWARKKQATELRMEDHFGVDIERNTQLFERLALKRVGSAMAIWL